MITYLYNIFYIKIIHDIHFYNSFNLDFKSSFTSCRIHTIPIGTPNLLCTTYLFIIFDGK